jgi:hypothetical protein
MGGQIRVDLRSKFGQKEIIQREIHEHNVAGFIVCHRRDRFRRNLLEIALLSGAPTPFLQLAQAGAE